MEITRNLLVNLGAPKYSHHEIMKIGIFSKDVKLATRFFNRVLPEICKRPKIVWKWVNRYSSNYSNREFKKRWYSKYHNMEGLPPKSVRVYTGRPAGPGPLEKAVNYRRQAASSWATAQEHKRVQKGKMLPTAFGPIRPLKVDDDVRKYVIPQLRTGKTELKRSKLADKRAAIRAVGRLQATEGNQIIATMLGGRSYVLPKKHHAKYWYFLRKRGTYVFSTHHPYGDEYDLVRPLLSTKDKLT
jgi:hypothetical protein